MKHQDRWTIKRSTRSMLWGSALAMLISCALFAGSTHAWFSDRCSAYVATVTAAEDFGVNGVKVVGPSGEGSTTETKVFPYENGVYYLESGTYTVTLTWVGDEATGGYYKITVGGNEYYSPNLTEAGFSFTLEITLPEGEESVSVTFTPVQSDVTKVEGVTTIDSENPISYPAVTTLFAMRGTEPEPDEPAESGTPEPGTEEKNNSEEVPSGTDGGSSGMGKTDDEGGSPVDVPLTPGANENANGNALENQ